MADDENFEAIDAIRKELRRATITERKEHRSAVLSKKRAILGDVIDNTLFTAEFVITLAKSLKRRSLNSEEYKQLQNALIQTEDNINSFLRVDNVLFALVRDLSGNNPTLQLGAAGCCCNIALGNSKACAALAKSTAPYLVELLESLNIPLVEVVLWTIGNLAVSGAKAFEALYTQACIKRLAILLSSCDKALIPSVLYATIRCLRANCIRDGEMTDLAERAIHRLEHDPNIICLLALLSSNQACITHLQGCSLQIIDNLHDSVKKESPDIVWVTSAIRLLANIVTESSGGVATAFLSNANHSAEQPKVTLNKLLEMPYVHVRKETLWLIGNLCNHPQSNIREEIKTILSLLSSLKQAVVSVDPSISYENL